MAFMVILKSSGSHFKKAVQGCLVCFLILSVEKRWITVILNGLFTKNSAIHSDHFVNCFKQFAEKSDSKNYSEDSST